MAAFGASKLSSSVARVKPASPAVSVAHVYRRSVLTKAPRKRTFIMVEMTRYTAGAVAAGAEQIQVDGGDWNNNCGGGDNNGRGNGGRGDNSNSNSNDEGSRGGFFGNLTGALAVLGMFGLLQPRSLRASTMEDGAGLPPATSSLGLLCLSLNARAAGRIASAAAAAAERRASGLITNDDEELVYGSVGLSSWERRLMGREQCQPRQHMRIGF